ncbi:hypothetical protein ACOSP7_032495 [Xanthoceras sorbifolium]
MAIIAILRRSASSLAPLASRLAGVNINYHSAVFGTALSHLNRKQTMKYVVPAFDFSSAIEIQNLTLDELLPQIIDLELKFADHDSVSEIPSDFPFKIKDSCGNKSASSLAPLVSRLAGVNINYRSAFLTIASSHLNRKPTLKYFMSAFDFSSANEIQNPTWDELLSQINELEIKFSVHDSVLEIPSDFSFKIEDSPGKRYDENLKKAFLTYLEVRGIKPSMGEFLLRYQMNKKNRENLMELKKIRNFIEHLSRHHTISNHS